MRSGSCSSSRRTTGCPALRIETWGLISLSGVIAIVAGVVLNRPARKAPWLVLAAAQASFAAGQLSFLIAAKLGVVLPFPSFADALYLSDLSAVRRRAADLHQVPVPRQGPAQPDRRADAHGRPRPAVVDLPDPALRAQPGPVRAAENRRDRLSARRRAHARADRAAARAGDGPDQVRSAPGPRLLRLPGVRRGLRRGPVARDVPQRDHHRSRLGPVLHRLGRRRAAPEHGHADRAGAQTAGGGLAEPGWPCSCSRR